MSLYKQFIPREAVALSSRARYLVLSVFFLIFTVASCFVLIYYWHEVVKLQSYGYLGSFLIALLAGSSIPLPISYLLITFTFGGILNPALIALATGVGAGIGGTLVFLFGRGGRKFLPWLDHFSVDEEAHSRIARFMLRFMGWAEKRGSVVVFLMSAMLNPAFAPMAITMGALRFRTAKFLLLCIAGNTVKSLVIAYAGYLGLGSILRLLG